MSVAASPEHGPIPEMTCQVWLKPFDLGVAQRIRISTPYDPETEQFKACLELVHLTGTVESWLRLNHSFVASLRRHFLHWRAVAEDERQEMFGAAKQSLSRAVEATP